MIFKVSADHIDPTFSCTNHIATVRFDDWDGDYSASIDGYGTSKSAATPEDAIRNMLLEWACTDIQIERVQ